jgi:hypothetical protein
MWSVEDGPSVILNEALQVLNLSTDILNSASSIIHLTIGIADNTAVI